MYIVFFIFTERFIHHRRNYPRKQTKNKTIPFQKQYQTQSVKKTALNNYSHHSIVLKLVQTSATLWSFGPNKTFIRHLIPIQPQKCHLSH